MTKAYNYVKHVACRCGPIRVQSTYHIASMSFTLIVAICDVPTTAKLSYIMEVYAFLYL